MTAERARVARELHDVVAHNLSVIAIQAAGADGLVARDPARATQIAALIDTVGREALDELGRLVGPLTGAGGEPATPHPSLTGVDGLAKRTRAGGLPVDLHVEGEPAALPAGLDLAAFRIVQEALANASKHAGGARAWVVVRYEPRAVEVEIGDDGHGPQDADSSPPGGESSGHGLMGMRERVALYGGTLDAGRRPEGGFLVRARLPIGRA
jgi:signal transduction histidine kinase